MATATIPTITLIMVAIGDGVAMEACGTTLGSIPISMVIMVGIPLGM